MSVLDFHAGRRTVYLDGRRFVIRRVTVAALVKGLELFSPEVAALRSVAETSPDLLRKYGWAAAVFFFPLQDGRMLDLLRYIVESDAQETEWPIDALLEVVCRMNDWQRIVESLAWSDREPDAETAEDTWVIDLARALNTTPVDIVEWPYEGLLALSDSSKSDLKPVDPTALAVMLNGPSAAAEA